MVLKIDISRIQLDQLDSSSLALISKFVYTLQKHNGTIIQLRDEYVLKNVVREAKKTDSAELKIIYLNLKKAMKKHLNSPQSGINIVRPNTNQQSPAYQDPLEIRKQA